MQDSNAVMERQTCFQFKTSFSPCLIMQITHYDLTNLEQQIPKTVSRAPNFFMGSAVVIDLEALPDAKIDFQQLKQLLLTNNLVPVGVRGGNEDQHANAVTQGIPVITIGKNKTTSNTQSSTAEEHVTKVPKKTQLPQQNQSVIQTKIITSPVRSGMQVYAKDADLIVVAPVSPGAEILADGNIHVYGALRGRALAGVQGNVHARIFCRTLEAELVAIAGYYLVKEDMKIATILDSTVQIYLENEDVKIAVL